MLVLNDTGKYRVKLINPNGSEDDTMREIVTALEHLNSISEHVFESLRTRMEEQRVELRGLTNRLTTAADQVQAIQGAQKAAIRVLSPAKYPPADNIHGDLDLTFAKLVSMDQEEGEMPVRVDQVANFRFEPPIKHPNDLLACFHVRETDYTKGIEGLDEIGLGKPPAGLDTIDSFLLFNAAQNPYEHYIVTGKQQTLRPIRRGEEVLEGAINNQLKKLAGIAEQPEVQKETEDFYYSPSTLQIPDINVPHHLPDLPGIVDHMDLFQPDTLPPFNMFGFQQQQPKSPPPSLAASEPEVLSSPPNAAARINVPQVEKVIEKYAKVTEDTKKAVGAPLPPPPPPPPPANIIMSDPPVKKEVKKKEVNSSSGGGSEDRSSLMAAIREAGGAGKAILKSAQDRKYEAKKKKQEEKDKNLLEEKSSDGLMSDLKNTLAMRRKGISGLQGGGKGNSGSGLGDIMQKLASTIPSMEDPTGFVGGAGDSDNDDDDDWD